MTKPRQGPDFMNPRPWRPKSSRVGLGPGRYLLWNTFYQVLEALNRGLARDPNRKVSWDKWPAWLGFVYLEAKMRFNRSNALTDPYDYAANDTKAFGPEPEAARHAYSADGSWVSDRENPQMGATGTRFGSNIPPKKVRPDVENMTPSAREVGKARWRRLDPETGQEIVAHAMILNVLAAWWIQFQFHNFGGNTERDPVGVCPHFMARQPKEGWPGDVALIDRTSADPTRLTRNGRPTPINSREQAWIQGQIYGSSQEELAGLRQFQQGKLALDPQGHLLPDPLLPGIDKTGFNNNFQPGLSLLHWLFALEHNAIADHCRSFDPGLGDEALFQLARKANVAQIARVHTVEWTRDLLQHPTLQLGVHADWYGLLGQRAKLYLMRLAHRRPAVGWILGGLRRSEMLWGAPGSTWEHYDGPFQVPKQFRMVYRLHELILGEVELIEPGTDRTLERIELLQFLSENTRPTVERYGYDVLAWSFVKKSCGALTLHNFPRALTQFRNQLDGTLTDLAERDIFRERTDGTGTYNEFRQSLGEPPVASFLELTGGDPALARELETLYQGDIDAVDAGIGILAEPKPAGFALGFTQFYQFVLNAPRRVKSNRHLTEGFTFAEYGEGMNWVEHAGGILGVLARHAPQLKPLMEGVTRGFSPWPETETFPQRMLTRAAGDSVRVLKGDLRTLALGLLALAAAVGGGLLAPRLALATLAALVLVPVAMALNRMLAMRLAQELWKKAYTDKRTFMFATLNRTEKVIEGSALLGRIQALAVLAGAGWAAGAWHARQPWVAALFLLAGLSASSAWTGSRAFAADAQLLWISLRNRMREGQPGTDPSELPGATALEKRLGVLPLPGLFTILLGDRGASLPGAGIYAQAHNPRGLPAGELDLEAFEAMFRAFAPGRDYLTAYDFSRMHEGHRLREAAQGQGNALSRWLRRLAAGRSGNQVLHRYADRVVEEDSQLRPAISKAMLLRFYNGAAEHDLLREQREASAVAEGPVQ